MVQQYLIIGIIVAIAAIAAGVYYSQQAIVTTVSGETPAAAEEVSIGESITTEVMTAAKEFTIEADDSGFYKDGNKTTSISADDGDTVKITFQVRSTGVYNAGLDFRSEKFDTGKVSPGSSTNVEFTADKTFTISSYWPSTSTKKADLTVNTV